MKKVLAIFGGNSYEHDISCKSVNYFTKNVDRDLFEYKIVGIDYNNEWYELKQIDNIDSNWKNTEIKKVENIIKYIKEFDIVFPIIHGGYGEDGKIQSLLELCNVNYVGSDSYSSIVCYDKLLTKLILEKYSIPQVKFIIYNKNLNLKEIKYPVIVKPCKCGSSIGISVVNNYKEMNKAIKIASKYDSSIIIEEYISKNRELECAILSNKNKIMISDIGEIENEGKWYDFNAKYVDKISTTLSSIDDNIKADIKNYSKKIFEILKCKSWARIDFLYDIDQNKIYFNEINTIPGCTEISMFPKLMNNLGLSNKDIITNLLKL